MLRRKLDFNKTMDVAIYLRMSSDKQNPKSPDQQRERIENIIEHRKLPWRIVATYTDEAMSGVYARKRPGFSKMLQDIENGTIHIGAVLVDTIERFGRMDDLESRRKRLVNRYGVVILTADRNFSDPYAPESLAMSTFENLRASDANRIKANDVIRGKIGAIEDGFWPGSPVPFGFRLEVAHVETRHRREIKHHVLVHDDVKGPIMRSLMEQSAKKPSWGQGRLTVWLNDRADIPDEFKPFHASTVGKWLRSPIYRGTLVWSEYSQGVVDDRRVLEKNEEQHVIRVEGFCEPIASVEVFKKVDANHELRRKRRPDRGSSESSRPRHGVIYSHPLTGLVRCGHCGASMVPNSTSPYTTKLGEIRNYCAYMCPNSRTRACKNSKRIKEEWLREVIIGKILERLTPDTDSVAELVDEARKMVAEQRKLSQQQADAVLPALEAELEQLKKQGRGWDESLGKSDLHPRQRENLVALSREVYDKIELIEQAIEDAVAEEGILEMAVRPADVRASLSRLHEMILSDCATSANLELSMHIDSIECFDDGMVRSRICKIGSSPVAVQWFCGSQGTTEAAPPGCSADGYQVKPRRRALLRIATDDGDFDELLDRIHTATDPNRFSGLPDHWFWIDEYCMPEKSSWVHENANAVQARFKEIKANGEKPSLNVLAREFGKSRPTISRALDIAAGSGDGDKPQHRREPKSVKGNPELESQIAQMHDYGKLNKEIAETLGIGRSTVATALNRLYKQRGLQRPDGRRERHK